MSCRVQPAKRAAMSGDGQERLEAEEKPYWLLRLQQAECVLGVAYAVSLPVSITLSWILLIAGLIFWLAQTISSTLTSSRQTLSPSRQTAQEEKQHASFLSFFSREKLAPFAVPLLIFGLSIAVSGAVNAHHHPGQNLSGAFCNSFLSLNIVLPYFWAFDLFRRSKKCAVTAVLLLLWVSGFGSIWAAIQQVFHYHPFTYPYEQGTGFLGHPMAFAGQMQMFALLSLGLFLADGYRLANCCPLKSLKVLFELSGKPAVFALIVGANLCGLFFAGERSAWLGGIAGILAITAVKSWRLALKAIAALTATATLSYFIVPLFRSRIQALFSGRDISVSVRQRIWQDCLQHYFPQSPVFGIGWLNFPHFNIPEAIVPGVSKDINHAHSNYIHILTTTGIIGLCCYIYLLICIFKRALSSYFRSLSEQDGFAAGVALGLFGAAVSLSVAGLFEFNFGTAQVRLAQWFLLGLL